MRAQRSLPDSLNGAICAGCVPSAKISESCCEIKTERAVSIGSSEDRRESNALNLSLVGNAASTRIAASSGETAQGRTPALIR